MSIMDVDTLIKQLGGGSFIARRLNKRRTAISNWKRVGLPEKISVRAALLQMAEETAMSAEDRAAIRDYLKGPLR
jgi:hypothetical protein